MHSYNLLMVPAIVTMFVSGVWHGAGYLFVAWGLLHGVYLTINHGWRLVAQKLWSGSRIYERIMGPTGFVLTFLSVIVSMVVFRSTSADSAVNILIGMAGLNGIELPTSIYDKLSSAGVPLSAMNIVSNLPNFANLRDLLVWLMLLAPIALLLPNTLQVLDDFEPAIGIKPSKEPNFFGKRIRWNVSIVWMLAMAIVAFSAISTIGGYTEFLYWQF